MNIKEIRKNAPDGANTYMLWFDSVVYFKSKRGVITHQWIKGYWNSCVNPSFKESYAYQCVSDYGYHNGEIKPLH